MTTVCTHALLLYSMFLSLYLSLSHECMQTYVYTYTTQVRHTNIKRYKFPAQSKEKNYVLSSSWYRNFVPTLQVNLIIQLSNTTLHRNY